MKIVKYYFFFRCDYAHLHAFRVKRVCMFCWWRSCADEQRYVTDKWPFVARLSKSETHTCHTHVINFYYNLVDLKRVVSCVILHSCMSMQSHTLWFIRNLLFCYRLSASIFCYFLFVFVNVNSLLVFFVKIHYLKSAVWTNCKFSAFTVETVRWTHFFGHYKERSIFQHIVLSSI